MRQPTRRANIRKTIAAHRAGDPAAAPLSSAKWPAWVAGTRRRARNPVKTAQDLDRKPRGMVPPDLHGRCRIPQAPAPPPLPAHTCKRPSGKAERRDRIKAKRARATQLAGMALLGRAVSGRTIVVDPPYRLVGKR